MEYNVCIEEINTVSIDNQKTERCAHCTRRYWRRVLREGLGSGLQDKRDLGKLRRKRHYWESKQLKASQRRNEHGSVKVMQG